MDGNQLEIGLLHKNPGELIVKYQPIVVVIVQVFMKSGYFRGEEKEEIVQQINEKLLSRIEKIRQQYNGIAQLRTYFSAVIRNLCLEIIRKGRNRDVIRLVQEYDHNLSYSPDQLNSMIINQELERLENILSMFVTLRIKMQISFKAILRIPVAEKELQEYCLNGDLNEIIGNSQAILSGSGRNDKEIYRSLTALFNTVENKSNSLDATRKWITTREDEVIELLNGNPPRAYYDQESFRILLERYFTREYDRMNGYRVKSDVTFI
jgi:RNA polymerase sigma factor (sigma-70 family)